MDWRLELPRSNCWRVWPALPTPLKALSRLPPSFESVVRLVDLEEWSYREAASELAVPLGTVMSRLHRGRRLLANTLAEPCAA